MAILPFFTGCTVKTGARLDRAYAMEVSVPQQRMAVYHKGKLVKTYPVSTSKFGTGDEKGSYKTPLGKFEVADKIGTGKPLGAVFKSRKWTGEVLRPNSPGRDPIVSRILWLHGLESKNKNAYSRCIYIHGTPAEKDIGTKASYGCVRMRSKDIIELYDDVGWGSPVQIVNRKLWAGLEGSEQLRESEKEAFFHSPDSVPDEPFWKELTPEIVAEESGIREGFELTYFDIEPSY